MKILAFCLLFVFLAGVLSSVTLASSLYLYMKNIDSDLDIEMLAGNLGLTTKIYCIENGDEEKELLRLHGEENRIWANIENIPSSLQNAFIAIEDHRFYEHSGIDLKRTFGAVLNFFGGKSYGGSTITQQLVKNLTGENQVTVKRKLTEIMRALALEEKLTKEEILELYLNNVYLSSGCFGVQTAAEKYFGKNACELTLAESASLAAIVQNPSRYDPLRKPENNTARRNTVLARMFELGCITEEEYTEAASAVLTLTEQKERPSEEIHSWFADAVIEDVIAELTEKYGISRESASAAVYSGGLSIHTTLDTEMQNMLDEFYKNAKNFPTNEVGTPDSAAVIIDGKTGAIRAIAGGRGEKNANRAFCLATKARRSPGSSLKPISVYAPAIDKNLITWATVFDDVPVKITKTASGFSLWPKNNPRIYSGLTTINKAIYNSVNTVAVQVLGKVGLQNSFDFCKKAGLSGLVEKAEGEGGKILSDIAAAPLAMGATSLGVTVRDMAGAYTMFPRGGEFEKPYTFTKVYSADGKLLLSHGENAEKLISEESADIMTRLLKNVVLKGTAKGMNIANKVEVAGKTGTSNSGGDKWFVGFTPEYVCGVWCGYRDGRDMGDYEDNPACTVFDGIMGKIYRSLPTYEKKFSQSDGVIASSFCVDSGHLPSKACHADLRGSRIETGYFKRGTEPKSTCTTHVFVKYDKITRAIACEKCPEENVINVGMLKVKRSFPCEVRITDSQYTYMYLPFGTEPTIEENLPYFARLQKNGSFYGTSGVAKAKNRYCREHYLETTTEATTSPPAETTAAKTEITASPSSTIGTTATTARTTSPSTDDTRTTHGASATTSSASSPQTTAKSETSASTKAD